MARKAYSEEDRVQVRNALMTTMIQCIADRGLIHSSIDVLCRKVGISKTFFYSFFSSKEELVLYALRYQQPKLLDYARSLMEDPGLSWRAGVETFLKNCCYHDPRSQWQGADGRMPAGTGHGHRAVPNCPPVWNGRGAETSLVYRGLAAGAGKRRDSFR